jgi:hypothetical protein
MIHHGDITDMPTPPRSRVQDLWPVDWLVILAVLLVFFGVWAKFQFRELTATPPGGTTRTTREIFDKTFDVLRIYVGRIACSHRDPVALGRAAVAGDRRGGASR